MSRLAREMDRMFEDFWRAPMTPSRWSSWDTDFGDDQLLAPAMEVHRHEGEIVIRSDLPGMKRDDVHVEVEDDMLTIHGERRQECEDKSEGHYRSECRYGSFFRSVPLPRGVNPDDVKADFTNGVLEIRVPVEKSAEGRKEIEVRGSES